MTETKLIHKYPPNIDDVFRVFPEVRYRNNVIFAHYPDIYMPRPGKLPLELLAHERVHLERQKQVGVEVWWSEYLAFEEFRFEEEMLAHRVELKAMLQLAGDNRHNRRSALKIVTRKFLMPIYGYTKNYRPEYIMERLTA